MALNLFTIPPHAPFLESLAAGWLARAGSDPLAIADGLILLPTRRSARALAEAFLRVAGGRPLLLPRITALGALDEAPLALEGALDLSPAVEPMQRLAALSRLIIAMQGRAGAPKAADRAWLLAKELAALMDEAERAEIDLAARLPDAADPAYAAHWAETLTFLRIVTASWPQWLDDNGLMNPAARQVALLTAQAAAWQARPPGHPVLIAGTTAGVPAVARLLRVVAGMPGGQVVLPNLDCLMDDTSWHALDDDHAQSGLARLLADLDARRDDVTAWSEAVDGAVPAGRFPLLSRALLPAVGLQAWRQAPADARPTAISRLRPADAQEEAEAIALILRDTLDTPGARAALVTPDRDLAGRVSAALLRYGIVADDSAGEKLGESPPSVFLRLLTRAVADELAPVALLSLLKHPLAAAGLTPAACRAAARRLETACLRGPKPQPGLPGLRLAAQNAKDDGLIAFLARVESCLEPALRIGAAMATAPTDALAALVEAAERMATTDDAAGPSRLWAGEEGEALATLLSGAQEALTMLPDQARSVLPGLLDALMEGQLVRSRRALRGRGGVEHPRVFIWGLLEARLQSVERLVLGGLVETIWPPATDPGPWLSRPMRKAVGLPSPELAVGQAAHDFVSAACAAPEVILSCPERRDGAPAVPARWLTRLDVMLGDPGLPEHPGVAWARALDLPANGPHPVAPPRPNPPVAIRPSQLSVTEIETWLRDPYAIYARHILKLRALDPLEQETDAADYGMLVHDGLHRFQNEHGVRWPPSATEAMRRAMDRALAEARLRPALAAWWAPRLERIADWVVETETRRRSEHRPAAIATEVSGGLELPRPGRRFHLRGRADRIERRADGSMAILDYKTGRTPTQPEVDAGLAPQLLLEAAMAAAGGFGPELAGPAAGLIYWHLTGGFEAGQERALFNGDAAKIQAAVDAARNNLCALIDAFDDPDRCYLAQPHPGRAPRFSDYAQLARVAEWSAAGDDGP